MLKPFGANVTLDGGHDEHAQTAGGFMRLFKPNLIRRTIFNDVCFADRVE
jgi:putative MFS transporter